MTIQKKQIAPDITVFTTDQPLIFEDIFNTFKAFVLDKPTLHSIWDLRASSLSTITYDQSTNMGQVAARLNHVRPGGKTAVVVGRVVDFGVSRMYETVSEMEQNKVPIKTFYNFDEALAWIINESE